jgi:hypothetical protein
LNIRSRGRQFTFSLIPVRGHRIGEAPCLLPKRSTRIQSNLRLSILLIIIAIACFVAGGVQASAASRGSKKNSDDDSSVAPRFSIHPNDITLAVSQKQVFGLTDANGKQVAVRWKISGVGCSASACGTIDANGAYQAPFSVGRPLVVMIEGIPLSSSEFPAFARIQLAPGSVPPPPPAAGNNKEEVATLPPAGVAPAPAISVSNTPVAPPAAPTFQTAATQTSATQTAATQTAHVQSPAANIQAANIAVSNIQVSNIPAANSLTVTYQNGRLTINATNETLANVLRLVAQKTGATIIVPPGTGLERIVEHAGPGPASEILGQLLKGSHFNFVMLGSPQRPNDLQQVLLTPRVDTDAPVVAAVTPVAAPVVQMETASTAPVDTVYTGPVNGGPQPRSRDEIRELLKERARDIREQSPPVPEPQAQQPAQAQPADSQPADASAPQPQ